MADTATAAIEDTAVQLSIPCECQDPDRHEAGCSAPADLWIIVHDLYVDCRAHEAGAVSLYVCRPCWDKFIIGIDLAITVAASTDCVAECESCGLHIQRRADVVHSVAPIRGTAR